MNRRNFLGTVVGAVASVAISSKFAPEFPKFEYKTISKNFLLSREELAEQSYAALGTRMHEALAESMMRTKEQVAMRVFWDEETDFLNFEGISAEEMYVQN